MTKAEARDLAFDQAFLGLRERLLRLANAHRRGAALGLAELDQKLPEEMRFSRASAAERAAVPHAGRQQRFKYFRCRDFQDGQ